MLFLSRVEEIILLTIWRLQDEAYGIAIREEVMRVTGKRWLLGAIYGPLGRLYKKGLVQTMKGDPTPEKGGRAKVFYQLTPEGQQALREVRKIQSAIWKDIPELEF